MKLKKITIKSRLKKISGKGIAFAGVIEDAPTFSEIGLNALNFLLSIVAVTAIISLVVSGIIYLAAVGNEKRLEQAKRASMYSIWGTIIALSALAVMKVAALLAQ